METSCLLEFVSHIDGKNARVQVFPDRVEWTRKGMSGSTKAILGVATAGLSLAATGVRGRGETEMIPIKSLTSVTTSRDKFQWKVTLIASGNTIEMRVSKDEAAQLKDTLTRLMLGTHPSQQASAAPAGQAATRPLAPPPPPPATPPPIADHDVVLDQIRKLSELHSAGVLSDVEFESKKHELLGRL